MQQLILIQQNLRIVQTARMKQQLIPQTQKEISGIVCWGDDLINGEESNTYSYMAVLQKLLTENGYSNLTVINKTLQGGGTLSMMKMAGVSDDTIQDISPNISRLLMVHS